MKVLTVTYSDLLSGAGIAALRLHHALRAAGVDSTAAVIRKRSQLEDVELLGSPLTFLACAARQYAAKLILRAAGALPTESLSANLFPTGLHRAINRRAPDIVHLHWIGAETIRIEEVARIDAPIVWTLHDEWAALGLEHYARLAPNESPLPSSPPRPRNRLFRELDRWVRERKRVSWRDAEPQLVTPSRWLAERVAPMISGLPPIRTIPNPLPLAEYTPVARLEARRRIGLADEGTVIAFGAMSGTSDPRKGYALLRDALATVSRQWNGHRPTLLVFGNQSRIEDRIDGFHCHFSGVTTSPERLALQYSAANAFVCPSVQENLPNTVAEALACGTPCVAFGIGGLPELIDAGRNGFLAKPFDTRDLARCIQLALALPAEAARTAARAKAEAMLAESTVAAGYRSLYEELVIRHRRPSTAASPADSDAVRSGAHPAASTPPSKRR